MLIFSSQDILTPGFAKNGIVIGDTEINPKESISGTIHIDKNHGPITLMLSSVNNPVIFDVQVETSDGIIMHKEHPEGTLEFAADSPGDYVISVKNLSLKSTVVSMSYGSTTNNGKFSILITVMWLGLLIGGNYLVVHSHFLNPRRSIF